MKKRQIYLQRIIPAINTPVIKVITGMRRVGKTYFLRQIQNYLQVEKKIAPAQILFIDKENLDFADLTDWKNTYEFIEAYFAKNNAPKYLFIDEVQDLTDWEKVVRHYGAQTDFDVYVSGSNSNLLSGELATYLTGRFIECPIYPLNFREHLLFADTSHKNSEDSFQEFLEQGGLPALHFMPKEIHASYIGGVFSTIIFQDVITRYNLRDTALIRDIFVYLSDNIGQLVSSKKIADYLRSQRSSLSVDRVRDYLQYFASVFLLHKAKRFDLKGKRHLELLEKYYLTDIGLRHYLLGFKANDIGQLLENVVYQELLVRGYQVSIGKWGEREIDFVAEKNSQRRYVQVSYLLASPKTIEREFFPLKKIKDNWPKLVLSMDKISSGTFDEDGIEHQYLLDWLLAET
jgi:predicted AAA+ superfamily ATPase